jgi:hypothetical protein
MMIDGDPDLETRTSQTVGVQGVKSGKGTDAVGPPWPAAEPVPLSLSVPASQGGNAAAIDSNAAGEGDSAVPGVGDGRDAAADNSG